MSGCGRSTKDHGRGRWELLDSELWTSGVRLVAPCPSPLEVVPMEALVRPAAVAITNSVGGLLSSLENANREFDSLLGPLCTQTGAFRDLNASAREEWNPIIPTVRPASPPKACASRRQALLRINDTVSSRPQTAPPCDLAEVVGLSRSEATVPFATDSHKDGTTLQTWAKKSSEEFIAEFSCRAEFRVSRNDSPSSFTRSGFLASARSHISPKNTVGRDEFPRLQLGSDQSQVFRHSGTFARPPRPRSTCQTEKVIRTGGASLGVGQADHVDVLPAHTRGSGLFPLLPDVSATWSCSQHPSAPSPSARRTSSRSRGTASEKVLKPSSTVNFASSPLRCSPGYPHQGSLATSGSKEFRHTRSLKLAGASMVKSCPAL
eukprot:TRINITY_DN67979_c0_g1_i1.p1 TRINITY_DN67979_c0_g1~~TRINITY_DN67979_c0_g1_i1.p1  ORF type:complete len:377 (+),score=27.11 TRINITY_DN67979_c0_g1_i1:111-1241(+)